MPNDILTIADALVEPPSEIWAFRTLTLLVHYNLHMDIIFHTTQEMKDQYYHYMKPRGLMDYINYIITEWEFENGVRVDVLGIYPNTVVVKAIKLENQISIFNSIKQMAGK